MVVLRPADQTLTVHRPAGACLARSGPGDRSRPSRRWLRPRPASRCRRPGARAAASRRASSRAHAAARARPGRDRARREQQERGTDPLTASMQRQQQRARPATAHRPRGRRPHRASTCGPSRATARASCSARWRTRATATRAHARRRAQASRMLRREEAVQAAGAAQHGAERALHAGDAALVLQDAARIAHRRGPRCRGARRCRRGSHGSARCLGQLHQHDRRLSGGLRRRRQASDRHSVGKVDVQSRCSSTTLCGPSRPSAPGAGRARRHRTAGLSSSGGIAEFGASGGRSRSDGSPTPRAAEPDRRCHRRARRSDRARHPSAGRPRGRSHRSIPPAPARSHRRRRCRPSTARAATRRAAHRTRGTARAVRRSAPDRGKP